MEEAELEEGEACFNDNDFDTTFSYIDQRLENVLGHFQKDFEGGYSADILGPKYGGYGSFLPAYKQSPTVHSHTKNPQKVVRLEGAPVTPADVKPASHLTFLDHNDECAGRKDAFSLRVPIGETCVSRNETNTSNLGNPTEPRSLKVRIKVGCDKSLRKNAAAIYSGLGLTSPSSSNGNNPEERGGTPSESGYDSPESILRDMTSFPVPGNQLLSPLNESLLCLTRMEKIIDNKLTHPVKGTKVISSVFVDDSRDRNEVSEGMKHKNSKDPFSEKGTKIESLGSKQCLTNDLKVNPSLDSAVMTSEAHRPAKKDVPVKKREMKKEWAKDGLSGPDFTSHESDRGSYEQKDIKHNSIEQIDDTKGKISMKKILLDVSKHETDSAGAIVDRFEKKVGLKSTTHEPHEVKVRQKVPSERKNKLSGISVKENTRSGLLESIKDKKSAQKDILKVRNSYQDILDTRVENQSNPMKALERPIGSGANHSDLGGLKGKYVPVNGVFAEASVVPPIEVALPAPPDNWVGCDRCLKWRLLPIGIEPDHLPEKWLCSMSTWLPGRNHCDISEDETTKAVQEMNLNLLYQNQNRLQCCSNRDVSGVASVNIGHSEHTNSITNSEKKNKSRPEGSGSGPIQTSHLSMDVQQHRQKRKSSIETNQPLLEKNMVNKPISLHPSKLSNFVVGRHDSKANVKDMNGGDLWPKKMKNRTGSDQYDYATPNKIKTEEQDSEQLYSSSDGNRRASDGLTILVKKHKDVKLLDGKSCDHVEMHAKKRKLKDWQESQHYADTLENSDGIRRKPKKLKIPKTEVKESNANKSGKTMKIILSASKDNSVDKRVTSQPSLNDPYSSRKDLESERLLFAATSSSSKVSDSCKRANLRKGSPVGSVSSSPLRVLNQDKLSRKGHAKITEFPRKLVAGETNMEGRRSVQDLCDIDASQRCSGKVESKPKETFKIRNSQSDLQALDNCRMSMKDDANGATTPQSSGKASSSRSKDNKDRKCSFQRVRVKSSDPLTERELFPNKTRRVEVDNPELVGAKVNNNDGKKIKLGEMGSSEVKPMVKKDLKKGIVADISKKRDSNEVEPKGVKKEVNPSLEVTDLDASKVLKHPGNVAKSLVNDCGAVKNLGVISFVKEYGSSQTAMSAFKRAEESKDYADRIKISGFDYECNDAYFDSALKFLYAASLLEACSTDFSKLKGVDQVHVYITAAKLCKTCAQEYEKRKEMAVAALAYKCMEVAYMRVVYCKSLVTKQDLQTSFQMVSQGESPSSSASDVDNLNNQVTMDKTMLTKSIAHPGNHVVARNQANFLRLLDFTSDVSLAMEASTNTQNAYAAAAAASTTLGDNETMNWVKRVVDFSFQDVKEVVCLVQHAREAINQPARLQRL